MKKALAVLFASLLTSASAATLPEIFTRDVKALTQACADGFAIQGLPRSTSEQLKKFDALTRDATRGRVVIDNRTLGSKNAFTERGELSQSMLLQSPAGTAYNICFEGTTLPMFLPSAFFDGLFTWFYIGGQAATLDAVKGWTAEVILLGAGGAELARFQPIDSYKASTDPQLAIAQWRKTCSSGNCVWSGANAYVFDLGVLPKGAKTLRVAYMRGKGAERRDYTAESFAEPVLTDPK